MFLVGEIPVEKLAAQSMVGKQGRFSPPSSSCKQLLTSEKQRCLSPSGNMYQPPKARERERESERANEGERRREKEREREGERGERGERGGERV